MSMLGDVRRYARGAVLPLVFCGLCGYFAFHAKTGERGLDARAVKVARLEAARGDLARVEAELARVERRVVSLRADRLDRDQLDERARRLLNLVGRDEVVVPYEAGRPLF